MATNCFYCGSSGGAFDNGKLGGLHYQCTHPDGSRSSEAFCSHECLDKNEARYANKGGSSGGGGSSSAGIFGSGGGPTMGQAGEKMLNDAGLGLAVGGAKLAAAGVGALIEAAKDTEEDKALRVQAMWDEYNKANFSDTRSVIKGINRLFSVFNDVHLAANDWVYLENREKIADACLVKIEEGIKILRGPEGDAKKADDFQVKLQKAKVKRLEIKRDLGFFETADHKADEYNKNMTIISTVSFEGGSKLVTKSLDSLFKIGGSVFGIIGGGKGLSSGDKHRLCNAAIQKINEGIGILQQDTDFDAKKTSDYEADLEKLLVNMNGIKLGQGEEFDASFAQELMKNISFEYSSAVTAAGIAALIWIRDQLFSFTGKGKEIYSGPKRRICDEAISKIHQGITLLKNDTGFDPKKISDYEADFGKLLVNRNTIKNGDDEDFDEDFAQGIIDNILLEHNSDVIAAGVNTLFWIKDELFSLMGSGKEIYSEPKRKICDNAIAKIQQGIDLLKNDTAFDAKKLSKYESDLADFKDKRENIKKSATEKREEDIAKAKEQAKEQLSAAGNQFKDAFGGIGKSLGGSFGGAGKGLGGLFGGKKGGGAEETSADAPAKEETAEKADEKPKGGFGGLGGKMGGGLGGLFGKKK